MKKSISTTAKLLFLLLAVFNFSCNKSVIENPSLEKNTAVSARDIGPIPNYQKLADTLAFRLKNYCVGYTFIVSHFGKYQTNRSGGQSRRMQDQPVKAMTMYDKFSIASVGKTITATALIKKMSELPGGITNLDTPIWPYLPTHWQLGVNIKSITFRQLLTHTSGLRYSTDGLTDGDDYQTLKNLFSAGVALPNKVYKYNNRNYSILRLIIPRMANYPIPQIDGNLPAPIILALEGLQAINFANSYKDYCRVTIFNKLGTTATQAIDCVNKDINPPLCYAFPLTNNKGILVSDQTLNAGAGAWVLTTVQVNDFFTTLQYTQTLLPTALSTLMKDQLLGYDSKGTTIDGINYYWKNGIYDWGKPIIIGAYRSLIIGFSDGVQITIMTNSQLNLQNAAILAHQDWHP